MLQLLPFPKAPRWSHIQGVNSYFTYRKYWKKYHLNIHYYFYTSEQASRGHRLSMLKPFPVSFLLIPYILFQFFQFPFFQLDTFEYTYKCACCITWNFCNYFTKILIITPTKAPPQKMTLLLSLENSSIFQNLETLEYIHTNPYIRINTQKGISEDTHQTISCWGVLPTEQRERPPDLGHHHQVQNPWGILTRTTHTSTLLQLQVLLLHFVPRYPTFIPCSFIFDVFQQRCKHRKN